MSNARTAPSGPFAASGATTLVGGVVTVTAQVPTGSKVYVSRDSGSASPTTTHWGALGVFVAADGLSFKITSSDALDTSVINWIAL
jgi:hypothetical protein